MIGQYLFNLALSVDQLVNTILLGDPDESISGRCGRAVASGQPKWWVRSLGSFIDWLFLTFFNQKRHINDSIEPEETNSKELWKWSK